MYKERERDRERNKRESEKEKEIWLAMFNLLSTLFNYLQSPSLMFPDTFIRL